MDLTCNIIAHPNTGGGDGDTIVLVLPRFDSVVFEVVGASRLWLQVAWLLHIDDALESSQ